MTFDVEVANMSCQCWWGFDVNVTVSDMHMLNQEDRLFWLVNLFNLYRFEFKLAVVIYHVSAHKSNMVMQQYAYLEADIWLNYRRSKV